MGKKSSGVDNHAFYCFFGTLDHIPLGRPWELGGGRVLPYRYPPKDEGNGQLYLTLLGRLNDGSGYGCIFSLVMSVVAYKSKTPSSKALSERAAGDQV